MVYDQKILWMLQISTRKKQIKMWKQEIKDLKKLLKEV